MNRFFGPCKTKQEVNLSIKLSKRIFNSNNHKITARYKNILWLRDSDFVAKNIYIAKENDKIIGIVRIIPRTFKIKNIRIKAACLSSICIDPCHRGKRLSYPLMKAVHARLESEGFNLSYLIARKAVDYYYLKFGYYGIPAHEKLIVKEKKTSKAVYTICNKYHLSDELISKVNIWYRKAYRNTLGFTERSKKFWLFTLKRIAVLSNHNFLIIFKNNNPAGYIIRNMNEVLELGFDKSCDNNLIADSIIKKTKIKEFCIPHTHMLAEGLRNEDVIYQSRLCDYGAHMFKLINYQGLESVRSVLGLRAFEKKVYSKCLPGSKLRYVLGIKLPFSRQCGFAFNLSFPDQI